VRPILRHLGAQGRDIPTLEAFSDNVPTEKKRFDPVVGGWLGCFEPSEEAEKHLYLEE
jgi:hypothetical protein